jgi:hypothetical protein
VTPPPKPITRSLPAQLDETPTIRPPSPPPPPPRALMKPPRPAPTAPLAVEPLPMPVVEVNGAPPANAVEALDPDALVKALEPVAVEPVALEPSRISPTPAPRLAVPPPPASSPSPSPVAASITPAIQPMRASMPSIPDEPTKRPPPRDPQAEIETMLPPEPLETANETPVSNETETAPAERPRWRLRIALLVLIVGGELALAKQNGLLDPAREVVAARTWIATTINQHTFEQPKAAAPVAPVDPASTVEAPAAEPAGSAEWVRESIPTGMGLLTTSGSAPGHRIFVDERIVGQTPHAVLVKCGAATVKIGSAGRTRSIDVPCGNEIAIDDR